MNGHIVNHIQKPGLVSDNTLHVIGVITNPIRYHSRYRLYREWLEAMEKTPNVKVYTVEAAFGDRHHEITDSSNEKNLQLRIKQEIWVKENLINLGVKHLLPKDWKYLAWVDCDVFFRDPNWANETIHQLQHFPIVQPWSDCLDLGFNGNVYQHFKSFGYQHQRRIPKQKWPGDYCVYAHTGFAWACTRAFWEQVQGLPDYCILGSCDHHAAFSCIGEVKDTIHKAMGESFHKLLFQWQDRAMKITHGEVGFVYGRIEHQFHGAKKRRKYRERWQILIDNKFDPEKDIMHDAQGLIQIIGKPKLLHDVHMYNVDRREDSTEENV